MVTLNYIPKQNSYIIEQERKVEVLINKNAKHKSFCKYLIINDLKDKHCAKHNNLCKDNETCKNRKGTLTQQTIN